MDKINHIEQQLGIRLPDDYKEVILTIHPFVFLNYHYCRILNDGYRIDGVIEEFYTVENFIEKQVYRDYLVEFQTHFEIPTTYVEAEFLYLIAEGSGSICLALGGQHYGKVYSADNGDFGITYQAENIETFFESLYDSATYRCTIDELMEAVEENNVALLADLIENRDGDKQIEHSSFLDRKLFDKAYQSGFNSILRYLMSKGYKGQDRVDYYKLKY